MTFFLVLAQFSFNIKLTNCLLQTGLFFTARPTEGQLLPGVWREGEPEDCHAGDQDAGDDEVEEVVEGPPPDLDGDGDVQVRRGAALVPHLVPLGRDS